MTSKIIVNNIESDVGISSVTFNDTISGDLEGNINSSGTSTFNVISGVSTIGVTTVHLTGINDLSYPTAGPLSKRNLIINGSFMVSQRSTSETVSGQGADMRTVDRFSAKFFGSGWASNHSTESQSTDAPPGHSHSYKVLADVAQDYSSALGSWIQYSFEGNQLLPLKTANLGYKEFTISFWLKSNKTGNVTVSGETAGQGHCFSTTVSINAANTWEYKTVTFPASPSSQLSEAEFRSVDAEFNIKWGLGSNGSWLVGTDESWQPYATNRGALSSLQTNFQQSANDYLAIGGIQMEAGSNATEFEYCSYAEELTLCQRYYQTSFTSSPGTGNTDNTGLVLAGGSTTGNTTTFLGPAHVQLAPSMRAAPTVTIYDLATPRATGNLHRHNYGSAGSNGNVAVVTDINQHSFIVRSDSGISASGIIFHYEVEAEL